MQNRTILPAALVLGLCFLIGSVVLGRSVERFRQEDRYISVKGFAEKEVKSDLVIWAIKVRGISDDLEQGRAAMETSRKKIIAFLVKNGVASGEIIQRDLTVTDRQANEYMPPSNGVMPPRYVVEETLEVRSKNVDLIQKVSRMTDQLLRAGVALSTKNDWSGGGLRFIFTKLNDIKPAMLIEATHNARQAAEQFAKESEVSLGSLKKASQGIFSIEDRDNFSTGQEGGGMGSLDIYKKVRVVVSCYYSVN